MTSLAGRTVVVTGAASGIGAAVTATVEARGGEVVALDLHSGRRAFDVRDPAAWQALAEELRAGRETVHGLVNCAGTTWRARLGGVTAFVSGAEIAVDGGAASHGGAKPVSDALRPTYRPPAT